MAAIPVDFSMTTQRLENRFSSQAWGAGAFLRAMSHSCSPSSSRLSSSGYRAHTQSSELHTVSLASGLFSSLIYVKWDCQAGNVMCIARWAAFPYIVQSRLTG